MKKNTSDSKPSVKAKPTPAPAKSASPAKAVAAKKPAAAKTPAAAPKAKEPVAPKAPKAPAKIKAPKAVQPKTAPAVIPSTTTLVANIDIGFGNQLFVRGEGAGLSWDQGTLLENVAADKWQVSLASDSTPITFKFLVNDQTWSVGEDFVAEPGSTVTLSPAFA